MYKLSSIVSPDLTTIWVAKAKAPSTWTSSKMLIIPNHSSNQSLRQCMESDASFKDMFLSVGHYWMNWARKNQQEQWDNIHNVRRFKIDTYASCYTCTTCPLHIPPISPISGIPPSSKLIILTIRWVSSLAFTKAHPLGQPLPGHPPSFK